MQMCLLEHGLCFSQFEGICLTLILFSFVFSFRELYYTTFRIDKFIIMFLYIEAAILQE